jgi:signal transduction histidine kinase
MARATAGSDDNAGRPGQNGRVSQTRNSASLGVTAAVLTVLAMLEVVVRAESDRDIELLLLLAVLGCAPVAIARVAATPAALAITGATYIILAEHKPFPSPIVVALVLTAYLVGERRTLAEAALVVLPYLLLAIIQPWQEDMEARLATVGLLALVLGATATGRATRAQAERAAHQATERALADTLTDHAARGERARIARELHDVVAHHISMISVQAETARLAVSDMPEEGARHLAAIGDTARTALTEMRRLLGVLREDDRSTVERSPQPALKQLVDLITDARESGGAPVRLTVRGEVAPLDPGIELTAYRVVQEALTNARRHAPGAAVDVEVEYGTDVLHVAVRDAGPGPALGAHDGLGVLGMRERAAMVGGTLAVGPAPGGGFLVTAVLPLRGTS